MIEDDRLEKGHIVTPILPEGIYSATLTGVNQFQNSYGSRLGFEFTLSGGAVDNILLMKTSKPTLSENSKLANILQGLMGRGLEDQELIQGVNYDDLIGTECRVLVAQSKTKSGRAFSNIEQIFR